MTCEGARLDVGSHGIVKVREDVDQSGATGRGGPPFGDRSRSRL